MQVLCHKFSSSSNCVTNRHLNILLSACLSLKRPQSLWTSVAPVLLAYKLQKSVTVFCLRYCIDFGALGRGLVVLRSESLRPLRRRWTDDQTLTKIWDMESHHQLQHCAPSCILPPSPSLPSRHPFQCSMEVTYCACPCLLDDGSMVMWTLTLAAWQRCYHCTCWWRVGIPFWITKMVSRYLPLWCSTNRKVLVQGAKRPMLLS